MAEAGINVPEHSIDGTLGNIEVATDTPIETTTAPVTLTDTPSTDNTEGGNQEPGTELPEGVTPEMLVKLGYVQDGRYKDLQREYTSRTDADKALNTRFDNFGGVDKATEMLSYLQGNPEFADFLKGQQEARIYGQPAAEVDPAQKEAMDIVQRIADERIAEAMKTKVDPVANQYKEIILKENISKMTDKYPNWQEMKSTMAELGVNLPPEVQDNPSLKDLESLYIQSLVSTGKINDFGKSIYEAELNAAKSKSINKPTVAKTGVSGQARTMSEAYALIKERAS